MRTVDVPMRLEPGSALRRFLSALRDPKRVQQQLLRTILTRNAGCERGHRFGFCHIDDVRRYQDRVPPCTYEDIRADIERMSCGESGVLTSDPVVAWEETGGSTLGTKLVPYTECGLAQFRAGLQPWLESLPALAPGAFKGRSYWSISPAARRPQRTPAGQPIGMESDAAYFGEPHASRLLGSLAVPVQAGSIQDMVQWRRFTLVHLAACADLSLISVWSPTFLTELLHGLRGEAEIIADMLRGDSRARATMSGLPLPSPDPHRAARLIEVATTSACDWQALWPELALISCWTHARAEPWANELGRCFPQARLQGKGLLATEALVTVPIDVDGDPVLAPESGFFEFVDDQGGVRMVHEVEIDGEYELLLTTASGLYRYAIGDRVRVTGWIESTPRLRFLGRSGVQSDLCGEKLVDAFVASAIEPTGLKFGLLAASASPPGYVLVVDARETTPHMAGVHAATVESGLCRNPQYAYARRLGQLQPVSVRSVDDPIAAWIRRGLHRGQRLGDIKVPSLVTGEDVDLLCETVA
jgi:hypothetical protein